MGHDLGINTCGERKAPPPSSGRGKAKLSSVTAKAPRRAHGELRSGMTPHRGLKRRRGAEPVYADISQSLDSGFS